MKLFDKDVDRKLVEYSVAHHKKITIVMLIVTAILACFIPKVRVDTDPENMLSSDEPVRVYHHKMKKEFTIYDLVVLGLVNETDPHGVYNPKTLKKVYDLTQFVKSLNWKENGEEVGVVGPEVMAPSEVDHVSNLGMGTISFEWLVKTPPKTQEEADEFKIKAKSNPLLLDTVFSRDDKAVAIYIPLTSKDVGYRVYKQINKYIKDNYSGAQEKFYLAGLPIAEDTFGVEMFLQMVISAPMAMLVVFILMILFFKKIILVISPMIVAIISIICTMGLLIAFGYPIHIMTSMIPIFLMPIAVVDSIHILSEFFDRYSTEKGRRAVIVEVMHELFVPMLYTSLTSAAGFASLALTPIPPVQIFGLFVAAGIMIAWICTVTFVPAYVMMISEKSLANFGSSTGKISRENPMARSLHWLGRFVFRYAKPIIVASVLITIVSVVGITKIHVNDNPVRWFTLSHPIRIADIELNKHFGGTYMSYLVLDQKQEKVDLPTYAQNLSKDFEAQIPKWKAKGYANVDKVASQMEALFLKLSKTASSKSELLNAIFDEAYERSFKADSGDEVETWDVVGEYFGLKDEALKPFKQPENLNYISKMQKYLLDSGLVGKSNSLSDIVKKVHQELIDGKQDNYRIPNSSRAVAQCLMQYQSGHKPYDLWHFVTNDFKHANIWLQLKSGDNKDMRKVIAVVNEFIKKNPLPNNLELHWAGLTYINVVWQEKMVFGMLQSFIGSFLVVFVMMVLLFRSVGWGLLCMAPLTITILLIYGATGFIGKDYDMPTAVLSSLTLGMAVDFAIHFIQRVRANHVGNSSWRGTNRIMFGEPARAISRNVIVIAVGFLPLLAAGLVPYKTVGIMLCCIMALSGSITLILLPAMVKVWRHKLFCQCKSVRCASCSFIMCSVVSLSTVVIVVLCIEQYIKSGLSDLLSIAAIFSLVLLIGCYLFTRRKKCRDLQKSKESNGV